jgi:hypothetical protein
MNAKSASHFTIWIDLIPLWSFVKNNSDVPKSRKNVGMKNVGNDQENILSEEVFKNDCKIILMKINNKII